MTIIAQNLIKIHDNIDKICKKYQRNKREINLIAVSKQILSNKIEDAINWGCRDFGENRVEEAIDKWVSLKQKYQGIRLHLIGHLQSKKVKNAVEMFDFIHSVDSIKLAKMLKSECEKQQKYPKIFIQVNIGAESSKTGIELENIDNFIHEITNDIKLPIFGLMCIPPAEKDAAPYFTLLHKIAQKHNIKNLSMGMSNDYESAIAINSNYIRIGSSIFGDRKPQELTV